MQIRMDVAEEYAATQRTLFLTQPHSGHISLLGAGNTASDKDQESTRMDSSAAQQCDGGFLDHQVTRQHACGDGVEFQ